MLNLEKLTEIICRLFKSSSYGDNLETYIVNRNPKSPGDVECLERQWHHRTSSNYQGGQWL